METTMSLQRTLILGTAAILVVAVTACSGGGGSPSPTAPSPTVSLATLDPTFTNVKSQVLTSRCTSCHSAGSAASSGRLNLESSSAYANLVNVASVGRPAVLRVAPGNPDASYLIHKLDGRAGILGGRMPEGGPYLSTEQIDLVKRWIQAGALNN
jgi:hypothetical protein